MSSVPGKVLVVLASLLAPACDLGAPVVTVAAGSISGEVTYAGHAAGRLVVETFASMPPGGPPLASVAIDTPSFPQAYQLTGLSPGEVFLTARLVGGAEVLGAFPSVLSVSPVVLGARGGLAGADFEIFDEGSRPEGPVAVSDARSLGGIVRFEGRVGGGDVLRGALYRSYPVRGAPADFQIVNLSGPVFPRDFEFRDVRDGTYYTVFYLDRGADSPFGPGLGDPVAWALDERGTPSASTIALGAGQGGVEVTLPFP